MKETSRRMLIGLQIAKENARNTLAVFAPWLAVISLVGCIGTVVVVAKKRKK